MRGMQATEPMGYEQFVQLLEAKMRLSRRLHVTSPREHRSLRAAISALDLRLASCEAYRAHLERYARSTVEIG